MKYMLFILIAISVNAEFITKTTSYSLCDKKQQSEFILDCIKNANPKSDEEPEDWIYMCKNMSLDLFCNSNEIPVYVSYGIFAKEIRCICSECTDADAIEYCKNQGFKTK